MSLKQLAGWVAVAFVIWLIIVQPVTAGHIVHNIGVALSKTATGITTFLNSI